MHIHPTSVPPPAAEPPVRGALEPQGVNDNRRLNAIILAAPDEDLALDEPKAAADFSGHWRLKTLVGALRDGGVHDVTVFCRRDSEALKLVSVTSVDSAGHYAPSEAFVLGQADALLQGDVVVACSDVILDRSVLKSLLSSRADVALTVDPQVLGRAKRQGRGLSYFSATGAEWLRDEIGRLWEDGQLETTDLPLLFSRIAARHPIGVEFIADRRMEVGSHDAVAEARRVH